MNAVYVTEKVLIEKLVSVTVRVTNQIALEYAAEHPYVMNVVFVTVKESLNHFVIVKETSQIVMESAVDQIN